MGRIIGFIIGVVLFVGSLPVAGIMLLEYVYSVLDADKQLYHAYRFI